MANLILLSVAFFFSFFLVSIKKPAKLVGIGEKLEIRVIVRRPESVNRNE